MLSKIEEIPSWLKSIEDKNLGIIWQVVKAYRANKRQGTVGVKTRSFVVSTAKKPYEQKKTGNARRGSFVSPICVGGGVAHGPKARDYRQAIPAKMQKLALKISMSKCIQSGKIFCGDLQVSSGKTKEAFQLMKGAYSEIGKTIVCFDKIDEATQRAFRNIRGVVLLPASQLNVLDIVESRKVILSQCALKSLETRLSKE